jgi:UPF0042 nucleotide-binding protein
MDALKIYIITGLSGSGKSTVIQAFEDASFYCVDNMPMELVPKVLELPIKDQANVRGAAFVMDMRSKTFIQTFVSGLSAIEEMGFRPQILFLEADINTLVARYSQTRRHHPLDHERTLLESIHTEKSIMEPVRQAAHHIIDTSAHTVHTLKSVILDLILNKEQTRSRMKLNILSFGYKYGHPMDADLVMDVRFLANPYFIPELRPQDGESDAVRQFVLSPPETQVFLEKYNDLIDYLIPLYKKENKAYLTLAVGCTGGRHRSVAIARCLFERLTRNGLNPNIHHRDIDREKI